MENQPDPRIAIWKERNEKLKAEWAAKEAAKTPEQRAAEAEEARQRKRAQAICDPDCPKCGGSGTIVYPPLPGEENSRYGTCPNYRLIQIKQNAKRYGMVANEIDGLDWPIVKDVGRAHFAMQHIQQVLEAGYGWVFLWGDHGQAKTLLLKIAIATSLRNGCEAAYTNMVGILDNLKRAFDNNDGGDAENKIEWWQNLPFLAIDEFNRVKESDWANERKFALMDMRYVQAIRHETVTLIASNTPPEQQDSYLRDRILDGRFEVIELKGPSVRKSIHDKDFMF